MYKKYNKMKMLKKKYIAVSLIAITIMLCYLLSNSRIKNGNPALYIQETIVDNEARFNYEDYVEHKSNDLLNKSIVGNNDTTTTDDLIDDLIDYKSIVESNDTTTTISSPIPEIDYKNFKFKSDSEYILNYHGGELEPEWQWVKDISVVYTWVDGNDVDFADVKAKYNGGIRETNSRDRSADELRYSLRSLEKYLPWHTGTIYILTSQQIPKWLDTSNPRIKMVYHKDIFPPHIYPTYDSSTIELYFDKIPGITERFIYFNDDLFLNNYVHPCFFFTTKNFYPKIYRRAITTLSKSKIDEIIRENKIHEIFTASKYYTREIIRKYFDKNFKYRDLYHTVHVFYRDLLEPMRQLYYDELKVTTSDRFRNAYKAQSLYLYHAFLQYATRHRNFPQKLGGTGKAKEFKGYTLPANRTIEKYSCRVITGTHNDKYMRFGKITDDSRRNNRYFNLYKTHSNLLVYNLNDAYTKNKSLYEFSEYMITRYPEPSSFEKQEYIELEKSLVPLFNKTNEFTKNITNVISSDYTKGTIRRFKNMIEQYKLDIISVYLNQKNELAGPGKLISDREAEEIDFLSDYRGGQLDKEWEWAKDISFVYILENGIDANCTSTVQDLKYSLRSLDKYLPWFEGTVYIVTQQEDINHLLSWVKEDSRIRIINQSEFIPNVSVKTTNKHIIEMYLDKIPDISEKFIYIKPNHFFLNYVHPRFFFSKEFYPKYNLKDALDEIEIKFTKESDMAFYYTYSIIKKYFGDNYVTTYRYLKDAPCPLYRDLFKVSRELYKYEVNKTIRHTKSQNRDLLPLYMVSTYNIYGTEQAYYPEYVAGYGKVRNAKLPELNPDRTVEYYGFDITSPSIANSTMLEELPFSNDVDDNAIVINKIVHSDKLFFSIRELDKEKLNSENKNNLLYLMNILFKRKSSFEN